MSKLASAARAYADMGWPVFPLWPNRKEPMNKTGCLGATTDHVQISEWWTRSPRANVALATGHKFFVWDVDLKHEGLENLDRIKNRFGPIPDTVQQVTGGGGVQYLFSLPDFEVKCSRGDLFRKVLGTAASDSTGFDIRGTGGYIVAPPSIHPVTKSEYFWDGALPLAEQTILPAPSWLLDELRSGNVKQSDRVQVPEKIPHGKQYDTLFKFGCAMRSRGAEQGSIEAALVAMNREQCSKPGTDADMKKLAASICRHYERGVGYSRDQYRIRAMEVDQENKQPESEQSPSEPEPPPIHFESTIDEEQSDNVLKWENPGQYIDNYPGGFDGFLHSEGEKSAITNPWPSLKHIKLFPKMLMTICGRPSMGKSAFALQWAIHIAEKDAIPVAFVSLEMGKDEIHRRILASSARVSLSSLIERELTPYDEDRVRRAKEEIENIPLHIEDGVGSSISKITKALHDLKKTVDFKVVFVDYLGLTNAEKRSTAYQDTSINVVGFKDLARDLDVIVILLAQLNRGPENENRAPRLSDLRDTGVIEEVSRIVLAVHRQERYTPREATVAGRAEIHVLKYSNGTIGVFDNFTFVGDQQFFHASSPEIYRTPPPPLSRPNKHNGATQSFYDRSPYED